MPEPMKNFPPSAPAANSNTISEAYRDSITISYRYIDSAPADTTFMFHGRKFAAPIMAGPIGGQKHVMENGYYQYAKTLADAGIFAWMDYHDIDGWNAILKDHIPAMRVIKPVEDIMLAKREIQHDTELGAIGYATDIDHGMTLYGVNDKQAQPYAPKTKADLLQWSAASALPFYVKGIMNVHDAVAAKEAGAAGIVVSGHNNRFPCAVPPLKVLPEIRKAVGNDFEVYIDGGFTNGYDVFKALALGADGVLVARSFIGAFAQGGAEGLTNKVNQMIGELKGALSNTGSTDIKHIPADSIILP